MPAPAASFEEHFTREIIASERIRTGLLAGLFAMQALFFGAMFVLFHGTYLQYFSGPAAIIKVGVIVGALVVYELFVRRMIVRRVTLRDGIPPYLRYLNAFIETSVPSFLILAVANETNPVHVLQSAAGLLYAVFIVLSTLRLDYRLSVFTGAVAALEYVALGYHYSGQGFASGTPFDTLPFYLGKGAVLLLCGLAAGFVGHQLKRRIGNAWRGLQDRQRMLDAFGQQVSPAIVDELMKTGGSIASRRGVVCVLFMDIRNFTPLVEHKSPEEIVAFQNAVFGEAIETVNRNHGIINQFLGDGFMATFGAPVATGNDCRNALQTARELVEGIRALGEQGRIPAIAIGVGLHVGEAVHGNVGSELRQQYSITGNVVILASRIEQLNKEYGSQVLVSREVLEAAGEEGGQSLGPVQVKGREQPIELVRIA